MTNQSKYNPEYQTIIFNTILKALETHPRLTVIRCDLRFPLEGVDAENDSRVITRFISSVKAKIRADLNRKGKEWGRNLTCNLNYVWVREFGDVNGRKHYHVLLFLNKDVYYSLGDFRREYGNLSAMIKHAWSSAVKLDFASFGSLVHFPRNAIFHLERDSPEIQMQINRLCEYANYLAKNVTKRYGDGERSIGSSL